MNTIDNGDAWLALPLSARGLVRELASFLGDSASFETCLKPDSMARAIADEVARLLSAYRSEYARIRRDVERLVELGVISLDGSTLRLSDTPSTIEPAMPVALKSTSASRMRRHRELMKARSKTLTPSHVTSESVTSAVTGDEIETSLVTDPLSFKKITDLHPKRARDGRDASHRMPPDLAFDEDARAIAARVGVKQPELTWMAFKAHYLERGTSARDWERVWETWAVREAKWEAAHARPPRPSTTHAVDLNAPWILAAGGAR